MVATARTGMEQEQEWKGMLGILIIILTPFFQEFSADRLSITKTFLSHPHF